MDPKALSVLRGLWYWREKEAKKRNRPPFFVLPPEAMVRISEGAAQGSETGQWLPRRIPDHRRREIRECIKESASCPADQWPNPHKAPPRKHITPAQKKRFEEIQKERDRQAAGLGIDPTIIASRATMVKLACAAEGVANDVLPWQQSLLGMP